MKTPTCIGIFQEKDGHCWWILSDGSKLSGANPEVMVVATAYYNRTASRRYLDACKYTAQYCIAMWQLWILMRFYAFLTCIQKLSGWPDHNHKATAWWHYLRRRK